MGSLNLTNLDGIRASLRHIEQRLDREREQSFRREGSASFGKESSHRLELGSSSTQPRGTLDRNGTGTGLRPSRLTSVLF